MCTCFGVCFFFLKILFHHMSSYLSILSLFTVSMEDNTNMWILRIIYYCVIINGNRLPAAPYNGIRNDNWLNRWKVWIKSSITMGLFRVCVCICITMIMNIWLHYSMRAQMKGAYNSKLDENQIRFIGLSRKKNGLSFNQSQNNNELNAKSCHIK